MSCIEMVLESHGSLQYTFTSIICSTTGSNTGIGKETAIDLAKRGARVILACRSQKRAEAALAEVKMVKSFIIFIIVHFTTQSTQNVFFWQ